MSRGTIVWNGRPTRFNQDMMGYAGFLHFQKECGNLVSEETDTTAIVTIMPMQENILVEWIADLPVLPKVTKKEYVADLYGWERMTLKNRITHHQVHRLTGKFLRSNKEGFVLEDGSLVVWYDCDHEGRSMFFHLKKNN